MKAFTKNEQVTHIANWDGKGTFSYQQAVVRSCGAKCLHLVDATNGVNMGRDFAPIEGQSEYRNRGTYKYLTTAQAEAKCLELAAAYLIKEKARMEQLIANSIEQNISYGDHYRKSMQQNINELHEPRSYCKTEWTYKEI